MATFLTVMPPWISLGEYLHLVGRVEGDADHVLGEGDLLIFGSVRKHQAGNKVGGLVQDALVGQLPERLESPGPGNHKVFTLLGRRWRPPGR